MWGFFIWMNLSASHAVSDNPAISLRHFPAAEHTDIQNVRAVEDSSGYFRFGRRFEGRTRFRDPRPE